MRITKKRIENKIDFINRYTKHEVDAYFFIGCTLIVDGKKYQKYRKSDDSYEGISNKEAYEILSELDDEAMENFRKAR